MELMHWRAEPLSALEELQEQMNRLFARSLSPWVDRNVDLLEGSWTPAVDVYDSKDDILVKADLPGLKKEDIEVTVEDNRLILKGEKKGEHQDGNGKEYLKSERFYGGFYRALGLPVAVDANRVKAVYRDGVLELTLPKREEVKPKQIDIRVN